MNFCLILWRSNKTNKIHLQIITFVYISFYWKLSTYKIKTWNTRNAKEFRENMYLYYEYDRRTHDYSFNYSIIIVILFWAKMNRRKVHDEFLFQWISHWRRTLLIGASVAALYQPFYSPFSPTGSCTHRSWIAYTFPFAKPLTFWQKVSGNPYKTLITRAKFSTATGLMMARLSQPKIASFGSVSGIFVILNSWCINSTLKYGSMEFI